MIPLLLVYGLVSLIAHVSLWFFSGVGCNSPGRRWATLLLTLPLAPLVPLGLVLVVFVAAVRKAVKG